MSCPNVLIGHPGTDGFPLPPNRLADPPFLWAEKDCGNDKGLSTVLAIILLGFAAVLFFHQALFFNRAAILWDAYNYAYPILDFVARAFRQGSLPLWNPFLFCGFPMVGDPQAQIFYPPNFFFYFLGHVTPKLLYVQEVCHIGFAGIGTFLLVRSFGLSRLAASISALSYMFSGFMIGHISHPNMLNTAAWLPSVFWAFRQLLLRPSMRRMTLAAFMLALCYFAGHPPCAFYTTFFLFCYFVFHLVFECKQTNTLKQICFTTLIFAGSVALAVLFFSIQLFPTLELLSLTSRRAPVSLNESLASGTIYFRELMGLIKADYLGGISGHYRGSYENTQHYLYVGVIPFLLFCAALLKRRNFKDKSPLFFILGAGLFLWIAMGSDGKLYPILFQWVPGFHYFKAPAYCMFVFFFCFAVTAGYGWEIFRQLVTERKKNVFQWVIPVLIFFDLFALGSKAETTGYGRNPKKLSELTESEKVLKLPLARLASRGEYFRAWGSLWAFPANIPIRSELFLASGYNALKLKRFEKLEAAFAESNFNRFLELTNTRYVKRGRKLEERRVYLPRAFLVYDWLSAQNDEEELELVRNPSVDLAQKIVISKHELGRLTDLKMPKVPKASGEVRSLIYRSNQILLNVVLDADGFLFLDETYHTGWKCYVNGKEAPVLRADYHFMAVWVSQGNHEIRFDFRPRSFFMGFMVTSATGVWLLGSLIFVWVRKHF